MARQARRGREPQDGGLEQEAPLRRLTGGWKSRHRLMQALPHAQERDRDTIPKLRDRLQYPVPAMTEKLVSGERREQLGLAEPRTRGRGLALGQDHSTNSPASEIGVRVDCADARRVTARVQEPKVARRCVLGSIQRGASAPASTPRHAAIVRFDYEVAAVIDELHVEPHDLPARTQLIFIEKGTLQFDQGLLDDISKRARVLGLGRSACKGGVGHRAFAPHVRTSKSTNATTIGAT